MERAAGGEYARRLMIILVEVLSLTDNNPRQQSLIGAVAIKLETQRGIRTD